MAKKPPALVLAADGDHWSLSQEGRRGAQVLAQADALGGIPEGLLRSRAGRAKRRILRLADDQVLSGRLTVPMAAEANLRQVVGFELDRLTPFAAPELHFNVRISERLAADKRLVVRFIAVPRARLDALLVDLRARGFAPDAVDTQADADRINLLPAHATARRGLFGRFVNALVWLVILGLLGAVLMLPLVQYRERVIARMQEVNRLKPEADAVFVLRDQVDQLADSSGFLRRKQAEHVPPLDVIRELTERIPQDTWIEVLDLRSGTAHLRGFSPEAASLIPLLEASPLLRDVQFQSPVLAEPTTGMERFYIGVKADGEVSP